MFLERWYGHSIAKDSADGCHALELPRRQRLKQLQLAATTGMIVPWPPTIFPKRVVKSNSSRRWVQLSIEEFEIGDELEVGEGLDSLTPVSDKPVQVFITRGFVPTPRKTRMSNHSRFVNDRELRGPRKVLH